jgi:hypothetical protein
MSLKALHIIFVSAATLLSFGFAAWCFHGYSTGELAKPGLIGGAASLLAGAALIVYGRYFLKKLKGVSYL